ncbi:MAG TPA: dipeptide/oligopeptide/nickel ABC transporter ATP-binding protein [Nocardioides bacterium]|uniref:ABC transporter ATP-binding protein n=1 Tax=uncultured Nocardioides sp. TaxID=198441 RepID=UPI000EDD3900|nr:ABC transporter ATP-binding protein [uncultured Nocardioides sp.]HCB06596.1 dipeptide/oligopeptide/nickel ABC transporter ATP-binding protein [Nocardioides sp.]
MTVHNRGPLLKVSDLSVSYAKPRKGTHLGTGAALHGATLEIRRGEIVGIVGETGSGKTTLARATVGLVAPATGTIEFEGRDLGALRGRELREFRRQGQVQLVFQDPLRSLDPDLTINRLVAEPLDIAGGLSSREKAARIDEALREVGLEPESIRGRRPRQLSGGQRQRVSLARAIVTRPALLFCDEPVSALDVSNRNLVLNLLDRLRKDLDLAVVVIAHDLSSLAGIADRVAVFYRSRLVEQGPTKDVLERPAHPYTALLTASAPSVARHHALRPTDVRLDADPADQRATWTAEGGCVFAARCRFAHDACRVQPELVTLDHHPAREAACYVAGQWEAQPQKESA